MLLAVTRNTGSGATAVTSYAYNANGDVTSTTDGAGRTVAMGYDAKAHKAAVAAAWYAEDFGGSDDLG